MRRLLDRLPLRLAEIAAVIVALSVGYLVTSHVDILGSDEPAFVRSATLGRTAHLSYGDVQVHDVRTAHALAPVISSDPVVVSSTAFVVVVAELTAAREPTTFYSTWLVDDAGRTYRPSERSGCDAHPVSDTGIPTYAMLCFELPTAPLAELRLEVARGNEVNDETRQDDVADLALDIDPGAAQTSADTQAAYQVVASGPDPIELETITLTGAS